MHQCRYGDSPSHSTGTIGVIRLDIRLDSRVCLIWGLWWLRGVVGVVGVVLHDTYTVVWKHTNASNLCTSNSLKIIC